MKDGKKLLSELAALSPVPVYVRVHNLLTTGDGTPALKWGSTNAYTEDAGGQPRYDWTIVDRIFDTYLERGMKPLVEIGFMPEALSVKPQPYRHAFAPGDKYGAIFTGWAQPPKGLREVERARYRMGQACRREVRPQRGRKLVVGGLERTRYRLLAGHPGGILRAVRLRGRRTEARVYDGTNWWPARHRPRAAGNDAAAAGRITRQSELVGPATQGTAAPVGGAAVLVW
jgi:hypothetical protein